jgi:hypothetical protein
VTGQQQRVRPPKPNQHERAQRQTAIDILLARALRGVLSVPEAAVLADYWRGERELADKTRRSLGETTRALQRNREAADAEIQRLEARVAELEGGRSAEAAPEVTDGPESALEPVGVVLDVRGAAEPSSGRTEAAA